MFSVEELLVVLILIPHRTDRKLFPVEEFLVVPMLIPYRTDRDWNGLVLPRTLAHLSPKHSESPLLIVKVGCLVVPILIPYMLRSYRCSESSKTYSLFPIFFEDSFWSESDAIPEDSKCSDPP